jgi:hypothetical protein
LTAELFRPLDGTAISVSRLYNWKLQQEIWKTDSVESVDSRRNEKWRNNNETVKRIAYGFFVMFSRSARGRRVNGH